MKEFMKTKTVTYNLMSFTAFKSMLLFSYLLEAPRSYAEIRDYFAQQKYLKETISIDTLRVYINSLERLGCEIVRGKKAEGSKYKLLKHPFALKISDENAKSIIKVFKSILKSIEIDDLLSITKFFDKIANATENPELKETLENISPLKKIDPEILKMLIIACRKNDEISILYQSPASGLKNIDVLPEKLTVTNGKVYLYGTSPNYRNTARFLVNRIKEKPVTKLQKTIKPKADPVIIGCELYDKTIPLLENEKIISEDENKLTIEITSVNKFTARQRILSLGRDCKVLYPQSFKEDIISALNKMKEKYIAEEV